MSTVFTSNEIEIFKTWIKGKKNKEIAESLQVSEPYVSQTLSKIQEKVSTLENSFELLNKIGIIEPITPLKLTDDGKKSFYTKISNLQKQKEQESKEQLFTFTSQNLEKTIVELIRSLASPSSMENSASLAKRFGIPIDVIEATKNTLNQITQQNVRASVSPSGVGVVLVDVSAFSPRNMVSEFSRQTQLWKPRSHNPMALCESPTYCIVANSEYELGET